MKATNLEFRLRYILHAIVFVLGFWAPWNLMVPIDPRGPNAHVWGILAANLSQLGVGSLLTSFNILLVTAILCAVTGAGLRTWGTAFLGTSVVRSGTMETAQLTTPASLPTGGILTDGPYGHLRNPLDLGTFLHTLALSLLMPRSGAIFAIVVIGIMQIRLILGEEDYLSQKLGAPYLAYCELVPRLFPSLRRKAARTDRLPKWGQAFLAEAYFWAVPIAYATLGWDYNAARLIQGVIVAFGIQIVCIALIPTRKKTTDE